MNTATNYLDVDAILGEEERMTVVFDKSEGAKGLGFLDSASVGDDLEPGSKVDLPLWLVDGLKQSQKPRKLFAIRTPVAFREMQKIHTEANAKSVDLKSVSAYYYEFGLAAQRLGAVSSAAKGNNKAAGLSDTLNKVMATRVQDVLDTAQNHEDDVSDYVGKLTALEHDLYVHAVKRSRELTQWKLAQNQTMHAAFASSSSSSSGNNNKRARYC